MPPEARFGFGDARKRSRDSFYAAVHDLCSSSAKLQFQIGSGILFPEICQLSSTERTAAYDQLGFPHHRFRGQEAITVSGVVPHSYFADAECSEEITNRELIAGILAPSEFCKRVSDLLVLANISHVGSVGLFHSGIVHNQNSQDSCEIPRMEIELLESANELAARIKWPRLEVIPLHDTWQWYVKRGYIIDGFDGTRLGRAPCAYSRLFEATTQGEPIQLLWALVGLESLYAKGKSDLSQQLREKSQAFLGEQLNFKKQISQMYNFRSRFVHGDLDFDGLSLMADARNTFERYSQELTEATATAIAMLAGTLQEIIRRDWHGLHFEYVVSNSIRHPA